MVMIRFNKDWQGFRKGAEVSVDDIGAGVAEAYVRYAGAAKYIEVDAQELNLQNRVGNGLEAVTAVADEGTRKGKKNRRGKK